jgi:cellulose biosynthesis protein BcsQ
MKITIFSLKGGVGKTSISVNLALTLKYGVITNDVYTPLERVISKESLLKLEQNQALPDLPESYDIIFDFGGYVDSRVIKAINMSNYIIIPVTSSYLDLQLAINTIEEIKKYNNKIIIAANMLTSQKDYFLIRDTMKKMNYKYPIMPLKRTASIKNIFSNKESIESLVSKGGLSKYHYQNAKSQFDEIVKLLK